MDIGQDKSTVVNDPPLPFPEGGNGFGRANHLSTISRHHDNAWS